MSKSVFLWDSLGVFSIPGKRKVQTITGTFPVLTPLTDGDTLSSAVTWGGPYTSEEGTVAVVQQMQINGGSWVAYNGATVVSDDETYAIRENTSVGEITRLFTSVTQTVSGIAPQVAASDSLAGRTLTITTGTLTGTPTPDVTLTALTLGGVDVLGDQTGTGPWEYGVPSGAASQTVAWTVTAENNEGTDTASGSEIVAADLSAPGITASDALVGRLLTITVDTLTGEPSPSTTLTTLTLDGVSVLGDQTGTGPWEYDVPDDAFSQTVAWTVTASNEIDPDATATGSEVVAANLFAPTANVAPTITGTVAENNTITINEGTYNGTTPITITGVLTLDGVDVTADMVAGDYTVPDSTEGQSLVWSETASNGITPNATQNVSATVASGGTFVPLPTGVWLEGDSYAGYLSGGFFRETTFEQDYVSTGVGGSTMTAAVARVATNQATYSDQVLVFWDGIYEDYTDAATAATNLDNIATNAGTTPWIYIPPIFVEGASLDRTTNIKVIRDNALAAYPDNVFNPYPILEGLAVGVDDDADVAAGRLPRSIYTADEIHLTDAAIDALMTPLIAAIKDKWLLVAGYSPVGTPSTILGGNLLSFIDPSAGGMLQTTGGAAVAADGDRIQVLPDQAGGTFTNANLTLRPTYRNAGGLEWIEARDNYLQKSLSRSGDIYICAAFRFPTAAGSNLVSNFYNSAPFYFGDFYALNRWEYSGAGHRLETNSGANLVAPSNITDIYVMELLVTATDRTIILSREEQLPATTTAAVAAAIQSTTNMTLFGYDSDTIEGSGDSDLYFYVAADGIPTTEQRTNLVGLAAQAAGLTLVPPQD